MPYSNSGTRLRGLVTWLSIAALLAGLLVPFIRPGAVEAAQVTSRSIDMSSSEEAVSAVTYNFAMTVEAGQTVGSFRVEFCNNDPLPGTSCTFTAADNIPNFDSATLSAGALDDVGNTDQCTSLSLESVTAGDRYVDFACACH